MAHRGGVIGNGMKVAYSATSPITWTRINEITDVVFPTQEGDRVDKTTHSPTNKRKRYISGLLEVNDSEVEVLTDDDPATSPDQDYLRQANLDGTRFWLRIERPINPERTLFRGYEYECSVLSVEDTTDIDDVQKTRFTFAFEGDDIGIDLAVGASEIS